MIKPAVLACLALTGCASVQPDTIRLGVEHLSSISQHLGKDPTNQGLEVVYVSANWEPARGVHLVVLDGGVVGGGTFTTRSKYELFEAKAEIDLWRKDQ